MTKVIFMPEKGIFVSDESGSMTTSTFPAASTIKEMMKETMKQLVPGKSR